MKSGDGNSSDNRCCTLCAEGAARRYCGHEVSSWLFVFSSLLYGTVFLRRGLEYDTANGLSLPKKPANFMSNIDDRKKKSTLMPLSAINKRHRSISPHDTKPHGPNDEDGKMRLTCETTREKGSSSIGRIKLTHKGLSFQVRGFRDDRRKRRSAHPPRFSVLCVFRVIKVALTSSQRQRQRALFSGRDGIHRRWEQRITTRRRRAFCPSNKPSCAIL